MQTVLTQKQILNVTVSQTTAVFGKKIGVMGKIFGCWHKHLTRPFTSERGSSYRACLECGARRRFDDKSFKTVGAFYYPPAISLANNKR